jgi:hypothetical protein
VLAIWNQDKGHYEIAMTAEEMGVTLFSLNYTAHYAKDVDAKEAENQLIAAINAHYAITPVKEAITTGIDLGHLGGY